MSQVPGTGNWLRAKDLQPNDTAEIITEANWEETMYKDEEGNKKNQYVCMVRHNGEEKKLKLTMKSCENLAPIYGKDSKDWIGKTIKFQIKDMEVGGRDVQSIRAFPMDAPDQPAKQESADQVPWDE